MFKYNHPSVSVQPHICIGSDIVSATTTAKYLGVNFHCDLSWKHHVSAIIDQSSRKNGVLWRYSNNMTEKEKFLFHKAVQPNIDYMLLMRGHH